MSNTEYQMYNNTICLTDVKCIQCGKNWFSHEQKFNSLQNAYCIDTLLVFSKKRTALWCTIQSSNQHAYRLVSHVIDNRTSTQTVYLSRTISTHTVYVPRSTSTHTVYLPRTLSTHTVYVPRSTSTHTVYLPQTISTHTVYVSRSTFVHLLILCMYFGVHLLMLCTYLGVHLAEVMHDTVQVELSGSQDDVFPRLLHLSINRWLGYM